MPYSFIWSPSVSTDSFVTGLVAGTYAVTINDANNCPPDTQSFELVEPPPITILVSYTDATCYEGNEGTASCSILSGGASPYIYLWTDTNSQTTANATGLSAGIYSVYVTDINNCDTVTESVEILQPDEPIDVELSNTCNDGGGSISSVTTGGTPPYVYQWSDGSVSSDLSGLEKGTYTVTVTDIYNCPPDIGSTLVPNCFISIPTAFTPNGNGSNDTWEITNLSLIPESRVTVYNRWGDIVFNSTGYEIPWDGKHMLTNTVLPTAVYYYIIEGVNPDFIESGSSLQGNVTLVK
ncbi:MAG TPA: T9SS type B sorting domain-containing protein [Flavobacteriales bacterium]|nr:T9SS type B sorting domain-containing protein [Flavobacteriales bacterium]